MARRRWQSLTVVVLLASAALRPSPATAAPGDLDPSFGVQGGLTTGFGDGDALARAVVLQPDGKLLAAGRSGARFALARYLPDGSLEPGFGDGGKVLTGFDPAGPEPIPGNSECGGSSCFGGGAQAFAVGLQPDGRIVVAGGAVVGGYGEFALARYLPNGDLDPSFGEHGKVRTDTPGNDARAFALAFQPDGKILAAGYTLDRSFEFTLARYLPDGRVDPTFGEDGIVVTDFFNGTDQIRALAVQPDGKIVASGLALRSGRFQFALARYLPDGTLDGRFGESGKATTPFPGGDAQALSVVLQPDGKLVASGGAVVAGEPSPVPKPPLFERTDAPHGEFALARYLPNGVLDPSFGADGTVTTPFDDGDAGATSLIAQADGKLVTAGFDHDGDGFRFALARYLPTGALDPSFGGDGKLSTRFAGGDAQAFALAMQPDGKLVAAGFAREGEHLQFALARYQNTILLNGAAAAMAPPPPGPGHLTLTRPLVLAPANRSSEPAEPARRLRPLP